MMQVRILSRARMETKRTGNTSEAKVLAKCVEAGWPVLLPFGDTEPYDLVIDRGRGFEKVQVKTGRVAVDSNGAMTFNAYSISGRTSSQVQTNYQGKADLFGVYLPDDDSIYLIPVSIVGTVSKPYFRLTERTINGQLAKVRWAKDYLVA